MDKQTEIGLIEELLGLKAAGSAYLDDAVTRNPTWHYTSEERFAEERDKIFRKLPKIMCHASELAEPGDFVRKDFAGQPLLLTRDKDGAVHAFLNVCRHRGTRLVDDASGCAHRFSCPYHAWTYGSDGRLLAAPHLAEGFPDLDKSSLNLKELACQERFGFIWVEADAETPTDLDTYLEGLGPEIAALQIDRMKIAAEDTLLCKANWKILMEGGIEAYHFKIAHRATIGPHFEDNLSSYQEFGPHLRSVLPRSSMAGFKEMPQADWRLLDRANVIYTLFPTFQMLVQQDHLIMIAIEPIEPGETQLRLATLVPTDGPLAEGKDDTHWKRNHRITMNTLREDFEIGESIQSGLTSGANEDLLFGRFEGALDTLNQCVNEMVG